MSLRISFLIDSLNHGGAERVLVETASQFAARGHDVAVDVFSDRIDPSNRSQLESSSVSVRTFGARRMLDPSGWRRLLARDRAEPVDVIHTQLQASDVVGTVIGRRVGIPTVSTQHVFFVSSDRRSNARVRLQHRVIRSWSARTIAVSEAGRADLVANHGYDADDVELIYNGVDLAADPRSPGRRSVARRRIGVPEEVQVIMACSVLREEKGIQHLLKAMSRLVERRCGVALVVLGSGPFEAPLRAMTEKLGLTDVVTFMGHRSDVADLLPAADVFCHPTLLDVLPTVIIEAMAASLPVVASRTGGIPELVENGVSGLLVEPGAPEPLRAALERLLSDPALAERFGIAGRQRVHQSFERTMHVDRLETLYRSVTGTDNHR